MKIIHFIKPYLKKYKVSLIIFVLVNIISWFFNLILPILNGKYIDILLKYKSKEITYKFILIIFIINISNIIISYYFNIFNTKINTKISFDVNFSILEHIKRLPIFFFYNKDSAYLVQRINNDTNSVVDFVISNLRDLIINFTNLIISIIIMFHINYKLAIILSILLPIYVLIYKIYKKPIYLSSYELKESQNAYFSNMYDQLSNIKFIKLNDLFDCFNNKLLKSFNNLLDNSLHYVLTNYFFSTFGSLINIIAGLIILLIGSIEIINNNLTIGEFIIMNTYFSMAINCTKYCLNFGANYQSSLASYERIDDIMSLSEEKGGDIKLTNIDEIIIDNVSFNYGDSKNIFENFSYKFNKGNIYCLIGENGKGKSTLINLILGLYNFNFEGEVYYNEINLKCIDIYYLRRKLIGITEQEPILIKDSIINNLTLGLNSYDYNDIISFSKELNLYPYILNLPNKFDTLISEGSCNLSGGEKQKISIIRTLLKNPDLIILDEPTSALDSDSIKDLINLLKKYKNNKIIIVISHDIEMIKVADHIIKM